MGDSEIVCLVIPNAADVKPLSTERDDGGDDEDAALRAIWVDGRPAEFVNLCAVQ